MKMRYEIKQEEIYRCNFGAVYVTTFYDQKKREEGLKFILSNSPLPGASKEIVWFNREEIQELYTALGNWLKKKK